MKISTTEARTVLPDLIKRAAAGETVELTQYGKTAAVLISVERYERLTRELFSESE
ncbi:type II toxin-antitoxin system prevent-host-death family antitoxin [Streptomyces mirabilis]|uniref:type II toxin-antitoxin system Phd/YefM family antitoxin n=1 Tax=Streptomyces sp. NPDC005388 TaxID=3156717 RepID=UPI0033B149D6